MTIEEIKIWADKNHETKPKSTIRISAETLFELLKDVCKKQFDIDSYRFNQFLSGLGLNIEEDVNKA